MRASLVCFKKVSKVGRASSGKYNLRGRMRVVSTIKYYNNIQMLRHTMCLPSYRNKAFPTQIFRKLLEIGKELLRIERAELSAQVDIEIALRKSSPYCSRGRVGNGWEGFGA